MARFSGDPEVRSLDRPTVEDTYMPHWARLRREAIALLTAGDRPGYEHLWKLAGHVRNEMSKARP